MQIVSEDELVKILDERKTRLCSKDLFWLELKNKSSVIRSCSIGEHNLLIDIPNKEQRDRFLKQYHDKNPDYDYWNTDEIPNEYKEAYKNSEEFTYPNIGLPLCIADIDEISSIRDIYKSILSSFYVDEKDIKIRNLEELEYRVIHVLKTLSVEMVIINYSGAKLVPSKKLNSILYSLCRISELCKITFNLFGSISPRVYYNESVNVPIGCIYCIKGNNNSNDVHFTTVSMELDEVSGEFKRVDKN